jgi:small conductance mechanosensitive channel
MITLPTEKSLLTREFWLRLWQDMARGVLQSALQVVSIVLGYLILRAVLYRLSDGLLKGLMAHETRAGITDERAGRLNTLQSLFKSVLSYVLFFVFGVLLLKAVGFDIMPFVETAGVIGLAIGFGAQKLVKDVISGFFIIVDNVFGVGDMVTIGPVTGQVQEMGLRVTRVLDTSGRLFMLPNGDIGTVTNLSRHPVTDFIEITVAPTADLNKVVAIVRTTGEKLLTAEDNGLKAPPAVLGVTAFSATTVTIRISAVADPRVLPHEQMRLREAVRTALLAAEIPFA